MTITGIVGIVLFFIVLLVLPITNVIKKRDFLKPTTAAFYIILLVTSILCIGVGIQ